MRKIHWCAIGVLPACLVAGSGQVTITEYPLPTGSNGPNGIAKGPDGNLWFTVWFTGQIGRITTSGVVTEFPLSNTSAVIAAGPDGNMWFTEYYSTDNMIVNAARRGHARR